MEDIEATMADVAQWLEQFAADEVVGRARRPCDCPLARFLRAQILPPQLNNWEYLDDIELNVFDDTVTIADLTYALAPWAQDFVSAIDLVGNVLDDHQVTAAAARQVLDSWLYDNSIGVSTVLMMADFPLLVEPQ